MVEKEEAGGGISEEEAAQYDRQIRLWGLEAQKRLRASRVLLVGMKGLGAEIAKNLILAGVKGLTMLDHEQVSPEGAGAQFLIRTGSVGRNRAEASLERAQNLNPMVDVKVDTEDIEKKPESFFTQFDAVCLTCCSRDVIVKVDQICHKNSIKFFTGDVFGYHGYTFANLGEHEFVEVPGHGQPTGLQVDYVFRAVEHVVRVVVSGQALELEVEDRMTADQWRGEFDASSLQGEGVWGTAAHARGTRKRQNWRP